MNRQKREREKVFLKKKRKEKKKYKITSIKAGKKVHKIYNSLMIF